MKLIVLTTPLIAAVLALSAIASAQEGPLSSDQPKGITPDQIIQKFAAKEAEFKEARDHYTYRQDVRMDTLDGKTVTGEYREVFDVTYDQQGRHLENVVFAPQKTLVGIDLGPEDLQDMRHFMPFVVTTDEIPQYDILYVGQQQEDELHCYVFDVAPKKMEKDKRYFQGRLWVDDRDLQVVKTFGKSVPDIRKKNQENLTPKFTTWREQIDGKYWFPTYTLADDTLHFGYQFGGDVHIREVIKYTDYKRFGSNVTITYDNKDTQKPDQKPDNAPKPQ